jgi:HSP20 family protein
VNPLELRQNAVSRRVVQLFTLEYGAMGRECGRWFNPSGALLCIESRVGQKLIDLNQSGASLCLSSSHGGSAIATWHRGRPLELRNSLTGLRWIKAIEADKNKIFFGIFLTCGAKQMSLPRLWTISQELDPYRGMRREMENALRAFDQKPSSPGIGAGAPAVSVAETKDTFEVTAELPGVDEKDINVSLDDNQLVISGEKKVEITKEEKNWHVEERSYGSFYRSMLLPFEPEDGAVEAHFDKGVLHLTIKKPAKAVKTTKTINIKPGAPPSPSPASDKPAAPNKAA